MLLSDLKKGDVATVLKVDQAFAFSDKIKRMGLTENVTIKVIRFAPLGDPMEIKLRNFLLAIRKSDAKHIIVEKRQ